MVQAGASEVDEALDGLLEGIVRLDNAERQSTIAWKLYRPSKSSAFGPGKNITPVHEERVPLT